MYVCGWRGWLGVEGLLLSQTSSKGQELLVVKAPFLIVTLFISHPNSYGDFTISPLQFLVNSKSPNFQRVTVTSISVCISKEFLL